MQNPRLTKAIEDLRKNEQQSAAYDSNGSFVVLAGPGSGKTKLLATKMAATIERLPSPRGVACITYSNECVRELQRRLSEFGVRSRGRTSIGTAHSFCLQHILRPFASFIDTGLPPSLAIASNRDQAAALQSAIDQILPYQETSAGYRVSFDRYRRTVLAKDTEEWNTGDDYLPKVIEVYEEKLHELGLIDFDDMVLVGFRLVLEHEWIRRVLAAKFPYVFVDEYQDLGPALHELVIAFLASGIEVFAVGDPDQSIYGFTGASPHLLEELSNRAGIQSTRLQLNYRSKQLLLDGAVSILGEAREYKEAPREVEDPDQPMIEFIECPDGVEQQAEAILETIIPAALQVVGRSLGDIAVLYPNKNLGDVIAAAAGAKGLPYIRIDQGAPYPKTPFARWVEDCAAWCAGGWKVGEPGLSPILDWWGFFANAQRTSSSTENWLRKVNLTRFLWSHRDGSINLDQWLDEFHGEVLNDEIKNRPDEAEAWARLNQATSIGAPLEGWTIQAFGGQAGSLDHLNLITLHSAKGREFDVVVMMGMDQGLIPSWTANSEASKREPRRLFYVGMTRARYRIYMTYSGFNTAPNGTIHRNGPSEFLLELQRSTEEPDRQDREAKGLSS